MIEINRLDNRVAALQDEIDIEIDVAHMIGNIHGLEVGAMSWICENFYAAFDVRGLRHRAHRLGISGLNFWGEPVAGINHSETRRLSITRLCEDQARGRE